MTDTPDKVVRLERVDATGLVIIDNPPVNASSHAVRQGLTEALAMAQADDDIDVIVVFGAGRTFIAGADIREFGKPPLHPLLPEVNNGIEASEKPVIAVLHGTALGGGFEVGLASHARIALPGTQVGLPEVTLGVLPGAGGTQRVPRLIGIPAALDMITSGRRIGADEALKLGLIDRIEAGDVRDVALRMAEAVRAGDLKTWRTGDLAVTPDETALEAEAERLDRTARHLFSPHKCVEAVALSTGDLARGLTRERELFMECIDSPQRAGLIHAFFAERAAARIPEAGTPPMQVESVGVIGGGTMGSGIATACLLAGLPVTLVEQTDDALDRGGAAVAANLAQAVKRGKLTEDARAAILSDALTLTTDMADLAEADLVIEAVFEDMDIKRSIFRRLDRICKPGAILATNTSYLDVNAIAAETTRQEDVIGLHFFSPAHVMRLLEVVVAHRTAPDVVATGFALAKRLRKVAVRAGVCDGFIGNRILAHYRKAVDYMLMDGASPQQIDAALEDFGFALGPFAVSDLAGLDIAWATRKRKAPLRPPEERYIAIADRICEMGWFGRKTGRGFYLYGDGKPVPNPDALAIVDEERTNARITPRDFTDDEIVARVMTAMISEATRVLEDGIALRPSDIDAVFLFGYGFPRHRGGPMHHADTVGAAELVRRIEAWARDDPYYWQVPPLLARMAQEGGTFAEMKEREWT
ncbi:3-hydroxyacyl-CoA dehydrogenase [Silicimonas algicola]|uniref:3-hydroxyacyl-CoA dehydrogenase n=1 Tax=Silicimonas algicola TaxID=1826607 RepID=A0A316G181_9RHOB|nr:3-hydroxyacyl-CoA dehydrogenase NAD-binding domain-containing protein [Silicimonas algicola]AZQ68257.1 3-hydroxyacyl-CoA dehydrogenase [Silicimonas algicola]PWK54609.1 3-hydroxyacyl-CoA dehydrogenase [Silicimonas algicola]